MKFHLENIPGVNKGKGIVGSIAIGPVLYFKTLGWLLLEKSFCKLNNTRLNKVRDLMAIFFHKYWVSRMPFYVE